MIEKLWHHLSSVGIAKNPSPVDDPWKFNVRTQIFCQNQEEHDYLSALNLIHGREIEINIWSEWLHRKKMHALRNHYGEGTQTMYVLPNAYTTWHTSLRGF